MHVSAAVSFPQLILWRCIAVCAGLTCVPFSAWCADVRQDWEKTAWRDASALLVDEALSKLPAHAGAADAREDRKLRYARAILLLNSQPKLARNVTQARDLLESLRQEGPNDELKWSARYYLARIAEFHQSVPDRQKAAQLYEELIAGAPGQPLAQEAVARLATLRLFDDVAEDERRKRLDIFEEMAARLTSPAAKRDVCFVLAEARLSFLDDRAGALRDLLAAEDAGIVRQQLLSDTLVRIAVLARDLGQREVAAAHYQKFLVLFQRDARAWMIGEQLKALQVPAAAPTP